MAVLGITYDIFRNGALGLASAAENARWIDAILRPTIRPAFSGRRLVLPKEDGGGVDVEALARDLGLPPSPDSWARLAFDPNLDHAIETHIAPAFAGLTHVIGFGLTPVLMRMLDQAGIHFIDLEIAQLRLSPQLRFRARTNSAGFRTVLEALRHPIADHIAHAQRALSGRASLDTAQGLRRGVFLGQTQLDLALVEQGRLRRPHDPDLLERLVLLTADLDEVQILTHPYCANRMGHLLPLIDALPKAVIGASGTYAMLAHPDTVRAISLSSGSLTEAALLGLDCHALVLPDRDNPACLPASLSDWIEVDDALFSTEVLSAFAAGGSIPNPPRLGAGLIEARFGPSQATLAKAGPIRQTPWLRPGFSYALGSDARTGPAGARCLQFGWSDPETWGVWSTGQVAALAFRLSSDAACRLTLRGRLFQHQAAQYLFRPAFEARVSLDGQVRPVTLDIDGIGWQFSVDLPGGLTDAPVFVHFLITGACAPSAFTLNMDQRKLGIGLHQIDIAQPRQARASQTQTQDAAYYMKAHRDIEGYRDNNWMIPFARPLRALGLNSIIECACGNGEFSEVLAPHVSRYWAMDWAASPYLPHSTPGFQHLRWDAYTDTLPQADLLCSANFLEHIREAELNTVLGRMLAAAPRQFHVIACYDDFHSHLTIEPPEWWLARLRQVSAERGLPADWQLLNWAYRNPERPVAVACNFAPEIIDKMGSD